MFRVCVVFSRRVATLMMMMMMMTMMMTMTTMGIESAVFLLLKANLSNRLVKDSRCRGGIVNSLGGCTGALTVRRLHPKALWQPRARTSNSPSGLLRLHTHTHYCHIYRNFAQRDIREYEDDHLKPPQRQYSNPTALWRLRASI